MSDGTDDFIQAPLPDVPLPPLLEGENEASADKLQAEAAQSSAPPPPSTPTTTPPPSPMGTLTPTATPASTPQPTPPPPKAPRNISSKIDADNIILGPRTHARRARFRAV
ncbi:hypothetical protein C8R45DRAFT_936514 [Mycena sanguinolenta]|nr:hypothetical protein C8R45DRAFT_936514 [Mycena sanguinolenta]